MFPKQARFHDVRVACGRVDRQRWPKGVCCPFCDATWVKGRKRGARKSCNQCGSYFDWRTKTVFDGTRVPAHMWLRVIHLFAREAGQPSPSEVQRGLGLRSHHTASKVCALVRTELEKGTRSPTNEEDLLCKPSRTSDLEEFSSGEDDNKEFVDTCIGEGVDWLVDHFDIEDLGEDIRRQPVNIKQGDSSTRRNAEFDLAEFDMPLGNTLDWLDSNHTNAEYRRNGEPIDNGANLLWHLFNMERSMLEEAAPLWLRDEWKGPQRAGRSYTIREAAALWSETERNVLALSRMSEMSDLVSCQNDEIHIRGTVRRPSSLNAEQQRQLKLGLSREVERPLPPNVWRALRDLEKLRKRALYAYLHGFWSIMSEYYSGSGEDRAIAKQRLNHRGLKMAFVETSTLSLDRCGRYARAIRLVVQMPAYDGTAEVLERLLCAQGGLDRATRAVGRATRSRRARRVLSA